MYRIPDTCNHFIQESICKHKGKNLNAWVQVPTGNQWQKKKKKPTTFDRFPESQLLGSKISGVPRYQMWTAF